MRLVVYCRAPGVGQRGDPLSNASMAPLSGASLPTCLVWLDLLQEWCVKLRERQFEASSAIPVEQSGKVLLSLHLDPHMPFEALTSH